METRPRAALAAASIVLFAVGCTSPGAAPTAPSSAAAPTSAASTETPSGPGQACTTSATEGEEVVIANFAYDPATLTVPAGTAVAWTNTDTDAHTVTFDDGPDCGRIEQDATVALQFDTVGTFSYFCAFHPNMRAEVVVE